MHNKAGNTANFQAGDISRRKKVKEKRPSPFLFTAIVNNRRDNAPQSQKMVFFTALEHNKTLPFTLKLPKARK